MKHIIICVAIAFVGGCASTSYVEGPLSQDFFLDLASENSRLAADLYLDYLNQDLSGLTYDQYLKFITENEAPSAKGFSTIVRSADKHYFRPSKTYFILVLYYARERKIIGDISTTVLPDSIHTYKPDEEIPTLTHFADEIQKSL